ncbi:SMP-30/gluconolactonase/LRE family protein [Aquimarina sp. 2201CG1-2-11]|uniref:SMP-30/gluconolactonase/LRE family protein n=1 Tax=Aquimarina discodermiae TaxID=3231043 RepID=UPI00346384D0
MKTLRKNASLRFTILFTLLAVFISCSGDIFDPELEVTTVVPEFLGNDAVTVDRRGNIYVSEFGQFAGNGGDGTSVFKITPGGEVSEFISDLSGPLGSAIDRQGNFYVVNASNGVNGEVLKIAPDGTREVLATIEGWPAGLALDHKNNLYVSNYLAAMVHKITPEGELTVFANDAKLAGGVGVDFDYKGNLIVGNFTTADILSISPTGNVSLIATIPDIVVNGSGIGYITVVGNSIFATGISVNKIFRVSRNGKIEEFAGTGEANSNDGLLNKASFNGPNGITSDKRNKAIYISEFGGTRAVRKIKLY